MTSATPRLSGQSRRSSKSAPLAGALLLGASCVLSGLVGCVSSSDIEGLHRHVGDVEKKVDVAARQSSSKEEVARLNDNVSKQVATLLRSNADLGTRFDDLTRELQSLAGKLEDANRRLAQLSQQIAETQSRPAGAAFGAAASGAPPAAGGGATTGSPSPTPGAFSSSPPTGAVVPVPGLSGSRGPSPSDIYSQALADYQRGQYDLARQGFQEYVDLYPKTDISDDALYWIGECWAAQKKPREAANAFDKLFKAYPQSDKAAAAHLKKAIAHQDLGEKAQAIVQLQYVVHQYPGSDEAKSARQRLKALGSDSR